MCGIVGTNFNPKVDFELVTKIMSNRGQDNIDIKQIKNATNPYFGHTRLSIIDLDEEANQPMIFDDILIVFNGEIYNYKELIKSEKLQCQTSSDTEVLIRLYQKYNTEFLNLLNGAFSFCIYDIKKDKYFCARDRYGKKPFYYYFKNGEFIFSSMIKPIIKILGFTPKMNKVALAQYLQYFVPLAPNTFYKDILKLDNESYIIVEKEKLTIKKYYKINTNKTIHDELTAIKSIEETLFSSVEKRLVSDVEVGSLLSGGIDSSLISTIYGQISGKPIRTFSVGYSEHKKYSELDYALKVAKNINSEHTSLEINQKDYIDSLDEVLINLEEPHADPASVPLYLLTKEIQSQNIKTVISGEGSDELFLGYEQYTKYFKYHKFKKSLSSFQHNFLDETISALQTQTKESEYLRRIIKKENLYNSFGEIFTPIQRKKLMNKVPNFKLEQPKRDFIDSMSHTDMQIWLGQGLLSKVDKMSMANGVETRNPFLDFRLVDIAFSIDSNLRMGYDTKYLIKKVASKYIPSEIINRPKKGFNSPFNEWLFNEFNDEILDVILKVNKYTDFFDVEYVKFIYNQGKSNKFKQHLYALWLFSRWYEKVYI